MKTLHLVLKHKWFDMIKSGEKLEEYREVTDYWISRLTDADGKLIQWDAIKFQRGYTNAEHLTVRCKKVSVKKGRAEWGASPEHRYITFDLGARCT